MEGAWLLEGMAQALGKLQEFIEARNKILLLYVPDILEIVRATQIITTKISSATFFLS